MSMLLKLQIVHIRTTHHRAENRRFSTLKRTKTDDTQPKLNTACFVVQSCLTDADFVISSNYCLIGTREIPRLYLPNIYLWIVPAYFYCKWKYHR